MTGLPPSWTALTIAELGRLVTGKTPSTKEPGYWSGDIPFVTPPDLKGGLVTQAQRSITREGLKVVNELPEGTVMTSCIGSIGRVGIVSHGIAASNQQINSLIVDEQKTDAWFCLYAIVHRRDALDGAAQKTTIPILNKSNFGRITLPIPPLREQRRIAALLSAVQRAIEQQKRLIALTAELKKALMHTLFSEGMHGEPQKETEIGLIPKSWKVSRLGSTFSLAPDNGLYKPKSFYGAGVQILRINDFSNGGDVVTTASNELGIDEHEQLQYALAENDIVVNRVNSLSHLGKTALIGALRRPMVFESNMMRFRVDESMVLAPFVFRLMNSSLVKKQVVGRAKRAVAQSSVNQGDVAGFVIPVPPLCEQQEILGVLEGVDEKGESHRDKTALLRDLFRTLLHQLMTAQLRVNQVDMSELKALGIEVD